MIVHILKVVLLFLFIIYSFLLKVSSVSFWVGSNSLPPSFFFVYDYYCYCFGKKILWSFQNVKSMGKNGLLNMVTFPLGKLKINYARVTEIQSSRFSWMKVVSFIKKTFFTSSLKHALKILPKQEHFYS